MPIQPMAPVIVGVDGSPASMAAVDLAAEEAAGRVAPLLVVHVDGERTRHAAGERVERLAAAHGLLAVAVAEAGSEHPGISVNGELLSGEPAQVLVDRSRDASLLVLGHPRRSGLGDLSVGSVARRVVSRAEVPLIVHRALDTSAPGSYPRPVLVGLGGVAETDPVVEFGFMEASLRGAPLLAMGVWPAAVAGRDAIHPDAYDLAEARGAAERMLAEALAGWSGKYPEVPVCRAVRQSLDAAVALTAASRSAQLTVVGSSRRAGSAAPWNAVCHALVHRAGCPVAVVPTE